MLDQLGKGARIRTKLLALLLGIGVPAVAIVGGAGYLRGEQAMEHEVLAHLTSVRATKAREIEDYVGRMRAQLASLAGGPRIIAAMRLFRGGYAELGNTDVSDAERARLLAWYEAAFLPRLQASATTRAQDLVPQAPGAVRLQLEFLSADGRRPDQVEIDAPQAPMSAYLATHARFDRLLRNFVDGLRYYDVFLIESDGGRVVYSASKEIDFGTSLLTGPHRESGLARAFRAARTAEPGHTTLVDFAAYVPSYGAPASFLAIPVFDGPERLGVLAVQLPVDRLNRVMTGSRSWHDDGLGDTGETYLVGSDHLMRTDSRFLLENPEAFAAAIEELGLAAETREQIQAFGTTILSLPVRTKAVDAALEGREGTDVVVDYRGIEVLSSYTPLNIEDVRWVLISEMDTDEALASSRRFAREVLMVAGILVLVIAGVAVRAARSLTRPIEELVEGARAVQGGDLSTRVAVRTGDELGELTQDFNLMVTSIRDQTQQIQQKSLENERLLLNILPMPIAKRLRAGETVIADGFPAVSVLFADIVGFTALVRDLPPQSVVDLLNDLFTDFDRLAVRHRIEKIKTIGDAYMAVAGLPEPRENHAEVVAELALDMFDAIHAFNRRHDMSMDLRIGIHSGPVVAGVIGETKFIYDLWGDTVNVASRMESHGVPGRIHISQETRELLGDRYRLERRGELVLKSRGTVISWFLDGRGTA